MPQLALYLADLVAVGVLVVGVYLPRHRRRDLVVAFLGVNVGVLAVSTTLAGSAVGAGVGLGLFGVLSIIRLRSAELDQPEVAYYFSALALGLIGGLGGSTARSAALSAALMALLVAVVHVAGHPRLLRRHRHQVLVLDSACTDEAALVERLEALLGARVHRVDVQRADLVHDTTTVDVRFERHAEPAAREVARPPAARLVPGPVPAGARR